MLMQATKRIRFWSFLILGTLVVSLIGVNEAQAAVAHDAASESHTGTTGAASVASFTWTHTPVGTPRGVLVFVYTISATSTVTSVTYGGVAMTQVSGGAAVDAAGEPGRVDTFFLGTGILTGARPVVVNRTNNTVVMYATAITQTAAADTAVTGIILLQGDQALAQQSVDDGSPGSNSVRYAGAYSGLAAPPTVGANSTLLHNIDFGAFGTSTVRETTAGQGARLVGFTAASDDVAAVHLAVREFATTIATGSDPAAATIAPGAAATDVNQFTLRTDTGTETITSVTVNLSTNSGVARLAITDAANTELGFTTSPVTGSNTISVSGMSAVSGSATTFKVRVTPLSHATMPAPAGGAYAITAPVTSWAGDYARHAGSDTNTVPLTIDNQSPGDVTGASGTAGDAQVVFNWTNPGGETVAYSIVVLRSTAAVADTPVEGTTYAVGNTIGASTVRCVVSGLPPATTCTDSGAGGPANDTAYYYKIFTRDSNGNYSAAGVPLGPFTPAANRYAVATGNWNAATTWSSTGCGGAAGAGVPTALTNVTICATRTVTLTANGACANLAFDATGAGATLQHNAGMALNVVGSVTINGSTGTDGTKAWSINAGSSTVGGNVTLNGGNSNARIARINTTTGTLTINGGLTYTSTGAVRAVINMSGGAGTLNLAGALTINTTGTLTPGTTSTFNFNGAAAQTIPIGVSSVVYNNLYVNNSHASGATLSAAISAANVTGDLRVQGTSILNNGGFAIVGNAAKTFEVVNGARFNLTGTSAMASGFGTRTFGATSTVNFQGGNQTIASGLTYGHLILDGGSTKTMAAGTTTIAGDFTLGAGTTRAATNNPTVNLAGNFSNSGTFNAGTGIFTFNGTGAQAITGATTFGNLVINNAAGVTANSDLTIVRNFTNTAGFNAGTTTTTFNGTIDQTITGATTFYNLTLNNTNGSGTELTLNNDTTVNNTLSFLLGNITTGANTLIIGNTAGCGVTGAGTGVGYVVGNLRKNFTASLLSCPFEIGDANLYTPVSSLTFASVTTPGTVTASTSNPGADHPDLANSGINAAASVNRYWTLTAGGGLVFTTCGMTFDYDAGDLDAGVITDDFIIRRKSGGTWSAVSVSGTPTTTQTSGTGATGFGDFVIGNPGFIYTRESEFIYTRELYY